MPWQVRVTRQCLDELGVDAGDAWALWEEMRRARPPEEEAGPAERLALGEYIRADQRVVGATRLASALGLEVSDAYDRPDQQAIPMGITLDTARERAEQAARLRRKGRGGWRDLAPDR